MLVEKHVIMDSAFWQVDILPPAFSFIFGVATEDPVTRSRAQPSLPLRAIPSAPVIFLPVFVLLLNSL